MPSKVSKTSESKVNKNNEQKLSIECSTILKIGYFICNIKFNNFSNQFYSLLIVALILRVLSNFYLSDYLTNSKEFTTPWNSFKRIKEAVFLQSSGVDPHHGDIFHLVS